MNIEEKDEEKEGKKPIIVRNSTDLQRLKLEKLMRNPDKPVLIPDRPKERGMPNVPDFVRNVMGSSAGAGSGEFHVYRHLRRKEYARQKYMKERAEKDKLEEEYHVKLEENKKLAEERTARKRLKRLKKKKTKKSNSKKIKSTEPKQSSSSEESDNCTTTEDESAKESSDYNEAHQKSESQTVEQENVSDVISLVSNNTGIAEESSKENIQ
ncbi:unnamed protein product [Phaedon cochleariae]|uniref:PRKR-interacting protein 1 n=1 Tax=Phaedon cochleariae TaxID=80249 RepID=A0A9N9SM49_PHACE|nr:unnamed protein product [Phaedon cochleariae]